MAKNTTPISIGTTNEDTVRSGPIPSNYKNLVPGTYTTEKGATVTIASSTWTYDPRTSATLQALDDDGPTADRSTVDTITVPMKGGGKQTIGTITVTGVNDAATAINHVLEAREDTTYSGGNLLSGSFDPDDQLTAGLVSQPAHGTASVNPNGSYTYTPHENYNGFDQFTFSVSDGQVTLQRVLNISVAPVNDAPVFQTTGGETQATKILVPENTTGPVTTISATDDGPAPLTYSIVPWNDGNIDHTYFTINSTTGALAFNTPPDFEFDDPGADDLYKIQVSATDGEGVSTTREIWVQVTNVDENIPAPTATHIVYGTTGGSAVVQVGIDGGLTPTGIFLPNDGQYAYYTSVGDVNSDGKDDVLISGDNGAGRLYFNNGDGTFADSGERFAGQFQTRNALADIDKDGDLDAAFNNTLGSLVIYQNNEEGGFIETQRFTHTGSDGYSAIGSAAFGDLNGDGFEDLYISRTSSDLLYLNDGQGQFALSEEVTNGGSSVALVGDLDGDKDLDLLTTRATEQYESQVQLNDGTGHMSLGETFTFYAAALGDLNGDGSLDAVGLDPTGAQAVWWKNDGHGHFTFVESLGSPLSGNIIVEDFTGDGNLDISYTDTSRVLTTWINDGTGNFETGGTLQLSEYYVFGANAGIL
jgi:VCBS repeat-containing protein